MENYNYNPHLGPPTEYSFYVAKSSEALKIIYDKILVEYEKHPEKDNLKKIALVKTIMNKRRETYNTLCVIDDRVANELNNKEILYLEKCRVSKYNSPKDDETHNLYIILPVGMTLSECQINISNMMKDLILYGLWKQRDFNIVYPGSSRTNNEHNGSARIYFGKKYEDKRDDPDYMEKIALTRMFIGGRYWDDNDTLIKCHWLWENTGNRNDRAETPVYEVPKTNIPKWSAWINTPKFVKVKHSKKF